MNLGLPSLFYSDPIPPRSSELSLAMTPSAIISPHEVLKKYKTRLFEAYGSVMPEYVTVPDRLLKNTKELQKYLELSYQYVNTLKPKPTKKKSSVGRAKKP